MCLWLGIFFKRFSNEKNCVITVFVMLFYFRNVKKNCSCETNGYPQNEIPPAPKYIFFTNLYSYLTHTN